MINEIDHIDPRWRDGRDYQLVCGFEACSLNFCERTKELNVRKSNNFLPWRVCVDELGSVPVEAGDLCLFLDPDKHEWVLEEFLGTWWYEKSTRFGARSQPKPPRKNTPETIERMKIAQKKRFSEQPVTEETRKKIKQAALTKKKPTEESRKRQGESLRGHKRPPETIAKMKLAALKRWERKRNEV